ncbi:MAG: hypothetical protein AVDCRST_MAG59-3824 [uncultured Thermomicrobiales bacterium]|uniref:Uncharacterized protein n=1 Tax=uncultured Thermomicrobiales bacterium TaxID=1645740 RepID=A0A6J4VCC1_9BACT|nr:MAG: hypothetical protein AVDCRST_MAG59-3824 [uncultured Thermomicrobiales bacterium]
MTRPRRVLVGVASAPARMAARRDAALHMAAFRIALRRFSEDGSSRHLRRS